MLQQSELIDSFSSNQFSIIGHHAVLLAGQLANNPDEMQFCLDHLIKVSPKLSFELFDSVFVDFHVCYHLAAATTEQASQQCAKNLPDFFCGSGSTLRNGSGFLTDDSASRVVLSRRAGLRLLL